LLRAKLPQAQLFLLLGQDMLAVRWFAWSQILRLCTVVAARRPGAGRAATARRGVRWLTMPQLDIASSDIRARLREGRSIRYLVPAAVRRYIRQHELYARGGQG
jgi:nicotinate-nucleotide adenylyltransferase